MSPHGPLTKPERSGSVKAMPALIRIKRNMAMTYSTYFSGKTGATYCFHVHEIGTEFIDSPGVYIFCAIPTFAGLIDALGSIYKPIYIGETEDLGRRLYTRLHHHHHFKDALEHGATHIAVMPAMTPDERTRVERDLIAAYQPPCNRETVNPRSLFGPS